MTSQMPTWEGFLVPCLQVLSDGRIRDRRELFAEVARLLALGEDQLAESLPSGQNKANNRAGWALSALARSEAIMRPTRGRYGITARGSELLDAYPSGLSERILFPAGRTPATVDSPVREHLGKPISLANVAMQRPVEIDPTEQIEVGVNRLNDEVGGQLLARLRDQNPAFLEQAVLDVLVAMGYGGVDKRARRIGGSGDGGVDGVIDQDPLGLEQIYVQAKRYAVENVVGREAIQAFVGALHGRGTTRGVFITTSRFSAGAVEYARGITSRVILIDGERLASLMIAHQIGVEVRNTYTVVDVDDDYFE